MDNIDAKIEQIVKDIEKLQEEVKRLEAEKELIMIITKKPIEIFSRITCWD